MPYKSHVDSKHYLNIYQGAVIPAEELEKRLIQTSRHIDSLTFNRIQDINRLTERQREIIQEVICAQADFEYANKDIFEMILSGYAINGVSMQFGESWNVTIQKGIPIMRDTYETLCQTGLCSRLLR